MFRQNDIGFKSELRLSPNSIYMTTMILGCLLIFGVSVLTLPWEIMDHGLTFFLLLATFSVTGWLIERWKRQASSWFTFIGLSVLILLASIWFRLPELLLYEAFPIALLAGMVGFQAAALATVIETTASISILLSNPMDLKAPMISLALFGLWVMLGILFLIYRPFAQLTQWLQEYFEQEHRLIEDARDRKAELEQALKDTANVNRQLALANKKMAILSEIAEEAQKAKTIFVANVSHEFRTPLNMIIGLIDLMTRSPEIYDIVLTPKMREDFSVIQRNCEHLTNMINDVLDLTRIETGRLALYREWVSLHEIVNKSIEVVRPLLNAKLLDLILEIPESLPQVYCDRVRIQQVILNLLSNAARFTDSGGVTVKVGCESTQVIFEVRDTGPGIQPEDARRIFEPFWQGSEPIWQKKGGSGLGLSLSKEFIRLHGGKMWFETSSKTGSSFFFSLPLQTSDATRNINQYIKNDWVWVEDSFKSSKMGTASLNTKPYILLHDPLNVLYTHLTRYTDQIEFIELPDLNNLPKDCAAQALLMNCSTLEEIQSKCEQVEASCTSIPSIGFSVSQGTWQVLQLGAIDYLVKPITVEKLHKSIDSIGKKVNRVLIVDDDPDVLQLFQRMLLLYDASFQIQIAQSGKEAILAVRNDPPELILLDIKMEDLDGFQVLQEINRIAGKGNIPTIFTTAQDREEELSSAFLFATLKGGIGLSKMMRLSMEFTRVLTEPETKLGPGLE